MRLSIDHVASDGPRTSGKSDHGYGGFEEVLGKGDGFGGGVEGVGGCGQGRDIFDVERIE